MGQPDDEALRSVREQLRRVEQALDIAGVDEERKKMIMQTLIFGGPVDPHTLTPMPDVSSMRLALEKVQTWFNARPASIPALNAEVMMHMNAAGYPIEGGVA